MQAFATLLDRLLLTPSRNGKIKLMSTYFQETSDPARGWALAAITRDLDIAAVKAGAIRKMAEARIDPMLFRLSYDYVGDMAETVSLIWPKPENNHSGANRPPALDEVVETLLDATRPEGARRVEAWMDMLDPNGRWALIKLVTGGLRIGVSARLAKLALADAGRVDVTEIEEIWHGLSPPYLSLFEWLSGTAGKPVPDMSAPFRPVMLAHPLIAKADRDNPDALDPALITPDVFAAEWKWDGIRVQAASERGTRRLYTRTGDDISHTFPDIVAAMAFEGALDGELLVRRQDGSVAPFNDLQQRLNRKTVSKKLIADRPAFIRAYDVLQDGEDNLRTLSFKDRRARLERFVGALDTDRFDLSALVPFQTINELNDGRNNPPAPEIEGLMLKRWDSVYEVGRPKGPWFKWKRDPYLIDAVMMYAQRGHGRRSSMYSDFTFGVWREIDGKLELAPVGKAYFGFTDEELSALDKFVRDNTTDRFGPVRAVTATEGEGLVLEVAFEGLQRSARHKSGIAMRFPRIHRIRWDKPTHEADRLDTLVSMLPD
ncbi:MAG: cisplatin damage response ATP-dependent DNA ligase [Pseudomonadota bacterium]